MRELVGFESIDAEVVDNWVDVAREAVDNGCVVMGGVDVDGGRSMGGRSAN